MSTIVAAGAAKTEQSLPQAAVLWCLKTLAIWLVLMAAIMVAGTLVPVKLTPGGDGPLTMLQALALVNGLVAVALSAMAALARVTGWRLGVLVFVALFGIQTAVMQIETVYFNDSIHMPLEAIADICGQGLVAALIVAGVAMLLFHPRAEPAAAVPPHMTVRIAALALIYVALYWSAGLFIAWQSEIVRAYYQNAVHIRPLPTLGVQIFRGTAWAMIALYVVSRLKGTLAGRAALMALLFAVLTTAQLLYPNPLVPWAVRQVHIVEMTVSETIYGLVATFVLLAGTRRLEVTRSETKLSGGNND